MTNNPDPGALWDLVRPAIEMLMKVTRDTFILHVDSHWCTEDDLPKYYDIKGGGCPTVAIFVAQLAPFQPGRLAIDQLLELLAQQVVRSKS